MQEPPLPHRGVALFSLLKFSKTTGAQSTDGHDKVLRPGYGGSHPLRTAGSSKGTILLLPDHLTAKSRPNLSGKSRSQRGFQARDPSRRRTFPTGCETRLSPASPQRSRGPSRRRPLHIVARFCAQRRQRSQGSRGGRRRLLRWRRSCARLGSRTVRLVPGKCRIQLSPVNRRLCALS